MRKLKIFLSSAQTVTELTNLLNLTLSIHCPNAKLKGKPYPDQILNCLHKNKFKKKKAAYIGDTYHDYLAAKRAGISFIFATYGFGKQKKIYKNNIKNLNEIKKYT